MKIEENNAECMETGFNMFKHLVTDIYVQILLFWELGKYFNSLQPFLTS